MKDIDHERAQKLLLAAAIEDITSNDRDWLDAHLATCSACSAEAGALATAVDELKGWRVMANPAVVQQTMSAVQARAVAQNARRSESTGLWIATAVSSVYMILTMPYIWRALAWFGSVAHIPSVVWQSAFLLWWFMPATALAAAAAWKHKRNNVFDWATQRSWEQR